MVVDDTHVKLASRPGGTTAKAEMDDVIADKSGHHARVSTRLTAESRAIEAETRGVENSGIETRDIENSGTKPPSIKSSAAKE